MALKSDSERVKLLAGWTFLQWAHAAAYMALRNANGELLATADLQGLMTVQSYWRGHHAGDEPPRYGFMPLSCYRWAWTCGAIAAAVDELFKDSMRPM